MRLAAGELAVRLLPDRGLDIGETWLGETQLAWLSGAGFEGAAWGGGLLRTCGLQNVGIAGEGFPLHGRYHDTRAQVLDGGASWVRGEVVDGPFALERELRVHDGGITIRDVTENRGDRDEQAPLLYHVNLGAPLWSRGGLAAVAALGETVPRDAAAAAGLATWSEPPEPTTAGERVWEHVFEPLDGRGSARLRNERTGLEARISWDARVLPRLWQWVDPTPGYYAFAFEPANCSVLGRAADRAAGRAPLLRPRERRETEVEIALSRLPPRYDSA